MIIFRIIFALIVILLYFYLGRRAAGSWKFSRLNMISLPLYYILMLNLLGGTLIYIGFREHYMIQKIFNAHVIDKTYYIIAYTVIMFPLSVIMMNRFLRTKDAGQKFEKFISSPVLYRKDMTGAQAGMFFITFLCFAVTLYIFAHLGYFPIYKMLTADSYSISIMRNRAHTNFSGNSYIRNIFMGIMTPFMSYYAYIYMKVSGSKTWRQIWLALLLLSICAVTYDFSKAPSVNYLLGYYLINIMLGNVNDNKQFKKFILFAAIIILFFYVFMMQTNIFSIYGGPAGRLLFTQIGTLFLHVDAFPSKHAYLMGASFYKWFRFILPNANFLRSGRVVMETYNPSGIANGTAGVMNTIFVGEAYANFGIPGVIIAPIIFGFVFAFMNNMIQNMNRRPEIILLYVQFTMSFTNTVEGGFIDIFYNASYVFIVLIIFMLVTMANSHFSISGNIQHAKKGSVFL